MEIKAKDASLWSKIGAIVIILVGSTLVGLRVLPGLTVGDVITVGLTVASVFVTVDFNLMLEKKYGRKTEV